MCMRVCVCVRNIIQLSREGYVNSIRIPVRGRHNSALGAGYTLPRAHHNHVRKLLSRRRINFEGDARPDIEIVAFTYLCTYILYMCVRVYMYTFIYIY